MKRLLMVFLIALICLGAVWARGGRQADGPPTIVVMPKLIGIPYFNASERGALQAGRDLGVNVIYTGPATADAAEQVRMLEDFIARGVNAIAVAPNDAAALTPVLRRARQAGIVVLDWDTPADPSVVDLSVQQVDNRAFAEVYFDLLVRHMGETGEYAILTGGLAAANLNTWIDLGQEYASRRYPGLRLVTDRVPTDEMQQVAYQRALDLITTYPNIRGILGYSTPTPIGAAMAVQERGVSDRIAVIGSGMPTDSGPYLVDGSLKESILWDPATLGYLTVVLAYDLINGRRPSNGQNVPNVGSIEVRDNVVIMGPPTVFTRDNYMNFPF